MLELAIRTLGAACVAALLAVAPAAADPGTTGGLTAGDPLVLSPAGGLDGPNATPDALASQAGEEPPASDESTTTEPTVTTPQAPTTVEVPVAEPASAQPSATTASSTSTGGGGLPRTGFAVAALVALGTGFFLTGYALRYSRTLDG